MRLHYISPSTLPSLTANSVHVVLQCDALCRAGVDVTLYAKRAMQREESLPLALENSYGVDNPRLHIASFYSKSSRGDNIRIAWMAVLGVVRDRKPHVVLSRNLYAAFLLSRLLNVTLLFETHQLEIGIRKWLQRLVMRSKYVTTILISEKLVRHLKDHHGVAPRNYVVLHDAAPEGIERVPAANRRSALAELISIADGDWRQVCGYFGHLYQGRGIEIVEAMAAARPDCLFIVYGGNRSDVDIRREANHSPNLVFMGHVAHPLARHLMCLMDVLMMPYQESVSIGIDGHDTARWMSPMKMFEYLGSGVPIISSDLPVLREILRDGHNCLLASPTETADWLRALDTLQMDPGLAEEIGKIAHEQYRLHHTWRRRADEILAAATGLL